MFSIVDVTMCSSVQGPGGALITVLLWRLMEEADPASQTLEGLKSLIVGTLVSLNAELFTLEGISQQKRNIFFM